MIPTSTNVSFRTKAAIPTSVDATAVFIAEKSSEIGASAGEREKTAVRRLVDSGVSTGKSRELHFDLVEMGGKVKRVYVAGLGAVDQISPEAVRQAAGALARAARKHKIASLAIVPPAGKDAAELIEAVVVGFLLASFEYREYKGTADKAKKEDAADKPIAVTIVAADAAARKAVDRGRAIADGQNFARTIATRPGNDINPPALAKVAQQMAREVGLQVRVLDDKQMQKLGMGGILAVGLGSRETPPRMIVLSHRVGGSRDKGGKSAKPILLVGKAVTFDTGGISIKPAEKMGKMVFDKCGAMTVLGLMYTLAKLDVPVSVVGILSSAENHISESAYRPGDLLRMYNGVTVEVTNTDAEGRLVLADALAWGIETYQPAAVVDLATLTGGVVVALGKTMAGVMSNNDALVADLTTAGESAGEKIWRLPLGEDQREQIKSQFADIVNSAGREGHPLQGGAFLSYFIPTDNSVPWAHLDIAGVADVDKDLPYYTRGATGWGVRTLLNWLENRSTKK